MKAYEARFETDKGDLMTITVIAVDLASAARDAADYEPRAGQGFELCSVQRATQVVVVNRE